MRKAVITGHTIGIGKSLFEALSARGYEVIGLSRSNGYDLRKDLQPFLTVAKDADLFINNAYGGSRSIHLLYRLYELWSQQDKMIINLGSDAAEGIRRYPCLYSVSKAALDKAVEQLQNCEGPCRVVLIRPGYVDTPRVAKITDPKLSTEDVVRTILWCLDQPEHVYIRNITLRHR